MNKEKFEAKFKNPNAPATWKQVTTIANNLAKHRGLHYPSIRNAILSMVFVEKGSKEIVDDPLTMQEAHELIQLSLSDKHISQEIMVRYESFLPTKKEKPILSSVGGKISEMVEKLSPTKTTDSSTNGLFPVEKGVPVVSRKGKKRETSAFSKTLKVLEVGDSFWFPCDGIIPQVQSGLQQHNNRLNAKYGWKRKIRTRTQENDGVIGVRVWRVE
tara:strand:- start:41 stop:685 length:645 start_codon:yes stop_codon:yes gene_type:complete